MSSLYELKENWETVYRMLEDADIDESMVFDTLESIEGEIEDKAVGYAKLIKNLEADVPALKAEADRLTLKARARGNKAKLLKLKLEETMKNIGRFEIKTDLFDFKIQKNPPSVEVLDMNLIPDMYKIPQEPKLDKKAILNDVKNGIDVKGCEIRQGEGLRIR